MRLDILGDMQRFLSLKSLLLMFSAYLLMGCSSAISETKPSPLYNLQQIQNHQSLSKFIQLVCAGGYPDMSLVRMLVPPRSLLSDNWRHCSEVQKQRFDDLNQPFITPYGLLGEEDEAWLFEMHRLLHKNSFAFMSVWKPLHDPRDINFLHRAFATRPYLTARMMASARGPLVGNEWQLLAKHMDRILLASDHDEDRRLLAFAMARDNREHEALTLIEEQLNKGDAVALYVLPYVTLDVPEPIEDEMADMSEPELGYRVVPMLERYLVQHRYPRSFCRWAAELTRGPLKYYVTMVLNNAQENMACPEGRTES